MRHQLLVRAPLLVLALGMPSLFAAACGGIETPVEADASSPDGSAPDALAPDALAPDAAPERVSQLGAGVGVACATMTTGRVLCWGANDFGQLGVVPTATPTVCTSPNGSVPCRATPTAVPGITDAVSVAVGFHHACAVSSDGRVRCWGRNDQGQLGHDPTSDPLCGTSRCSAAPTVVANLAGVAEVAVGYHFTCARTTAGAVRCWGFNGQGTLGNGVFGGSTFIPSAAVGLSTGVTRISSAGDANTTCAVKDGAVYCWGTAYGEGNLGIPPGSGMCTTLPCSPTPTRVGTLSGVIDVAVGERAVCVAVSGGSVRCWGWSAFGQLGAGPAPGDRYTDAAVPGLSQVVGLSGSMAVTCARTQAGQVRCWGIATAGSIGDGDLIGDTCAFATCHATPTTALLPRPAIAHAIGGASYAIDDQGTVYAWGPNTVGELGHAPGTGGDVDCGGIACRPAPTAITFPSP